MCLFCSCFCNCCNTYSSKCVEFNIFILSSVIFLFSFLCSVCIKWSHLTTTCLVLLILQTIFSAFMALSSLCINIFRCKGTINTDKNTISCYCAIISLSFCIIIFFVALVGESLIQAQFKFIDYPCKDVSYQQNSNILLLRFLSLPIETDEERIQFCKDKTADYNANICSKLEYTMSYLSSTIIEFCTLILCFFWYNDYRRIREKIDGELPIYENAYLNHEIEKNEIDYRDGLPIDPSDRYLDGNQGQSIQSNIVFVHNQNRISRKNQQDNVNKNKLDSENNFIRNLRKEMQEGIESIDEESSENKDNDKINDSKEMKNSEDQSRSEKNSQNNNENDNIIIVGSEEANEKKLQLNLNCSNEDNSESNEKKENNENDENDENNDIVNIGDTNEKKENNNNINNGEINEKNEKIEEKSNNINKVDHKDNKVDHKDNIIFVDEGNKDETKEEKLENNDDIFIFKNTKNKDFQK